MGSQFEESRLERLKQDLEEKPEGELPKPLGGTLSPHDITVGENWGAPIAPGKKKRYAEVSAFKFVLGFLILLFAASIGILLYALFHDPDASPSDKNVGLRIDAPVAVAAGEPVDLVITVANKNRVSLAYANLIITFPDGTRSPVDITKPLVEEKKLLGEVIAGGEISHRTKAIFLGEEKSEKTLLVALEYRLDGVNSAFEKTEEHIIQLSASPINVTIESLKEVNTGQELEFKVILSANTREILNDILLKVDYPFGFTFKDASEKAAFQNNVWRLGNISPGSKKVITIRGTLTGEDGQDKVFRAYAGTQGRQEYEVETVYGSLLSSVVIKKPFLAVNLRVGNDESDPQVAQFGVGLDAVVSWKNNLASRVTDAEIDVVLRGSPLDRRSIQASNSGFYRSVDDTIHWDHRQTPSLVLIDSGRGGEVGFSLSPLPAITDGKLFRNPEITIDVTVRGKRTSESGVPEEIKTLISRKVHFTTDVKFASRLVYFQGPFQNTGPIPPRVDQETTYTVIWSIVNTSNNVSDAMVVSRLPSYVTWLQNVDPQAENIFYDENRGTITWNAGEISAGTGIVNSPRQVAFQVAFTPSLGQVNRSPDILLESEFTGTDTFTDVALKAATPRLNTALPTDPLVPRQGGVVAE